MIGHTDDLLIVLASLVVAHLLAKQSDTHRYGRMLARTAME